MSRPSLLRLLLHRSSRWRRSPRCRAPRLRPRLPGVCEGPARLRARRARRLRRAQAESHRARRGCRGVRRADADAGARLDAGPAAGVLDQRLQPVHASRDRRSLSDSLGAVHTAAAQQHPADRRRLDDADLARGRPHGDARRHRASHPASRVQGASRPLRRSTARRSVARRWRPNRTARQRSMRSSMRPRGGTWPAERGLTIEGEHAAASRRFWNGMAMTSSRVSRRRRPAGPIASNARFEAVVDPVRARGRGRSGSGSRRPGSDSSTTTGR